MQSQGLVAMCLSLLTVFTFSACDSSSSTQSDLTLLRPVKTYIVEPDGGTNWREFPGVVEAVRKAELNFQIGGKLEKVRVKEGELVSQGQLLAQLDTADITIQLKSREAEYRQAKADYDRSTKLVQDGLISRSDFGRLEAQEASARARLNESQQNLAYASLKAPFAGTIAQKHADNFEVISAQQSIFSLQDTSKLLVKVDVPEQLMIRARRNASPQVFAVFDAIPDRQFPLAFEEITTRADAATNTFQGTFSMEANPDFNILPGMSVTVRGAPDANNPNMQSQVFIPANAVVSEGDTRIVYVVSPEGEGVGSVAPREVETGKLSDRGLQILSGLNYGDEIVTAGVSKMQPGLKVKLSERAPL